MLFRTLEHSLLAGMRGLDYAAHEARFEAKTSERNRTGGRSRRRIFVAGGRRIGSNRADHGHAVVGYSASIHAH